MEYKVEFYVPDHYPRPMFIGVLGEARSGKDTVAQVLIENYNFTRLAFADVLKKMVSDAFNIPLNDVLHGTTDAKEKIIAEYGKSAREIMQEFGVALRKIYSDFWIKQVANSDFSPNTGGFVFSDVRFENELKFIKDNGGITIKVQRSGGPKIKHREHISETGWKNLEVDYVLDNNGTLQDLKINIVSIMSHFENIHKKG